EKEVELLKVKYNLPQSEFYMCLATLEPRKNLRLLIDAYADLILEGRTDKKLVLAGRRGWKINDLLNNLDENVKNNIVLTGFIDDKDLPKLYKSASVFIFPSLYEGFGIPALEALACGTQTIVSNIPIFKEAFGDAVTYFLNNDKDDLKNKMITYKDVDSSVIKKQVEKYDWGKSAKVYIDIINSR
ncbi:TPA: glycosyltransferase family 4 protein, partial [Enterococcus faecium]|nr:glycosyltransferase family 4 protein [Enterococcus faecium]